MNQQPFPHLSGLRRPRAVILAACSVVGSKEAAGPLGQCFDCTESGSTRGKSGASGQSGSPRDRFGQDTWEKAESEMQRIALSGALNKAGLTPEEVGILFSGDLLNQCAASAYGLVSYGIPTVGLYGACSTSAEGLMLAACAVDAGFADAAAVVTSSHNAAAERQFRTPLEYGGQRPGSSQWTVTGAGAFVIVPDEAEEKAGGSGSGKAAPQPLARITAVLPGIPLDRGVTDPNNMGAAMAPAAESTLCRFFAASGTAPGDYDLIVTGDLGWEGGRILCDLMDTHCLPDGRSLSVRDRHNDCGMMIFSKNTQDTHSGGSGCGCSASVLASFLLPRVQAGQIRRMLFLATGALMSPDSLKQGQSIPGIAHLLCLETLQNKEK